MFLILKVLLITTENGDLVYYPLTEILDLDRLEKPMSLLSGIHNVSLSILDNSGELVYASGWQDLCAKFHRVNESSSSACSKCANEAISRLNDHPYVVYTCESGLTDAAAPFFVDGVRVGTVLVGQVFVNKPSCQYFLEQAQGCKYDVDAYLAAVKSTPVVTKKQVVKSLLFVRELVELLAEGSLRELKRKEAENQLQAQVAEYAVSQKALMDSEKRYRHLYDASFGGLCIHDNGVILDCNQGMVDLTGYSFKELIGMDIRALACENYRQFIGEKITDQSTGSYDIEGLRKDGSIYPVIGRSKFIPYEGRCVRAVELRDLTERKQNEQLVLDGERRFRLIIEAVPIPLVIYDDDGLLVFCNKAFESTFGYTVDEIPTLNEWWPLAYPDQQYRKWVQSLWANHVQLASEDRQLSPTEVSITCKDGRARTFLCCAACLVSNRRRDNISFMYDITSQKESEMDRVRADKLESLGVLAGGIAHDFNNILSVIMGNLSFAQTFLDKRHPAYESLMDAEVSSIRAESLARQMLTFAKGGEPIRSVIDLRPVLKESVLLSLRGTSAEAEFDIAESVLAIDADEGQLSQVFHNIAINAVQSMGSGGLISVKAGHTVLGPQGSGGLPNGDYVLIQFSDVGCGMSPDVASKAFDPYFTTKKGGTGLGLASSYSIITRHGGSISISSVIGYGTTFKILLPALTNVEVSTTVEKNESIGEVAESGVILVMDDDKLVLAMSSRLLALLGYKAVTCENGEEAISLYKSSMENGRGFVGVIMDLTIRGGMGGVAAAKHLLTLDPDACLIVSSGYSTDPVMSDPLAYGFKGSVAKPYSINEFGKVLRELIR